MMYDIISFIKSSNLPVINKLNVSVEVVEIVVLCDAELVMFAFKPCFNLVFNLHAFKILIIL